MKHDYQHRHRAVLLALISLLAISPAQACMKLVYIPEPVMMTMYEDVEGVFANPPLVLLAIEGEATLNLLKQNASDRWVLKNASDFDRPFHAESREVMLEGRPITQIHLFYMQTEGQRNRENPMAWDTVKESVMPLRLSYEAQDKAPREVEGKFRVTRGKQVGLTPEIRDSVIQIAGPTTEGRVYGGRPFRIEWADPAMGKHRWQVQEAVAEADHPERGTIREPVKIKAETAADGQLIFRGEGRGQRMRIVLKAVAIAGAKSPRPQPVTVRMTVDPIPMC